MSDTVNLDERFEKIKECAWKGKIPPYQGENAFSEADYTAYEQMKSMYERYKLRQIHKDMAEKEVESLRLRHIQSKAIEKGRAEAYRELNEKRQNTGQWIKELINYEGKSQKEVFELIFCCLIPALTNEVAGKKIKEGAGYFLLTGEKNLTEKEREELKVRYA